MERQVASLAADLWTGRAAGRLPFRFMGIQPPYSPEVRERAVGLVLKHRREHPSEWATLCSIAEGIGCSAETLRLWLRRAETEQARKWYADDSIRDVIHSVSRTLCGARLRLSVAIWIRTQPKGSVFYPRQIAQGVGDDVRYVYREIQVLEQLGMIAPQPPRARDVRRFYQADHTHPLWAFYDTTLTACAELDRMGGNASR